MTISRNKLLTMYRDIKAQPVDPQIVLLCANGVNDLIDISIILAQYKYCLQNTVTGFERDQLRKCLVYLSSEQDVSRLEVM